MIMLVVVWMLFSAIQRARYAPPGITCLETSFTWLWGGSCFFQQDIMCCSQKSMFLELFKQGSLAPRLRNILCKLSLSNLLGKDLWERYLVFEGFEKGIEGQLKTEGLSLFPSSCGGAGLDRRDFGLDSLVCKACKDHGGIHFGFNGYNLKMCALFLMARRDQSQKLSVNKLDEMG